jgi:hypothetical protein
MPPILQTISPHQGRVSGLHFDLGAISSTRRHLSLIYVAANEWTFQSSHKFIFIKGTRSFTASHVNISRQVEQLVTRNERENGVQWQQKFWRLSNLFKDLTK